MIDIVFRKRDAPAPTWILQDRILAGLSQFEWATPCREEGVTQLSDSRVKGLQTPKEKTLMDQQAMPMPQPAGRI